MTVLNSRLEICDRFLVSYFVSPFQLNEIDFQDSIMALGFSEELQKELMAQYLQHRKTIRTILRVSYGSAALQQPRMEIRHRGKTGQLLPGVFIFNYSNCQ